jgi:ribonuclease-3
MTREQKFGDPIKLIGLLGVQPDMVLLEQALTHRSFAYENDCGHYERLEFLGDAILQQVVTLELFERFPDLPEGDLAKRRATLVSTTALAHIARELELGSYIRLGRGEEATGGSDKSSILADVVESIIGATFISEGDKAATGLVLRLVEPLLADAERFGNSMEPKTVLQEYFDRKNYGKPEYRVEGVGPDHARIFEATVFHDTKPVGSGAGSSKKLAEANAALDALKKLGV